MNRKIALNKRETWHVINDDALRMRQLSELHIVVSFNQKSQSRKKLNQNKSHNDIQDQMQNERFQWANRRFSKMLNRVKGNVRLPALHYQPEFSTWMRILFTQWEYFTVETMNMAKYLQRRQKQPNHLYSRFHTKRIRKNWREKQNDDETRLLSPSIQNWFSGLMNANLWMGQYQLCKMSRVIDNEKRVTNSLIKSAVIRSLIQFSRPKSACTQHMAYGTHCIHCTLLTNLQNLLEERQFNSTCYNK